jgi:hemoglobin
MPDTATRMPPVVSARPAITATLMARTGLDERALRALVHRFYGLARRDPVLGPVFAARIVDWDAHLERMTAFWSAVALSTGRYHGRPVPAHAPLRLAPAHFARWLTLFRAAAGDTCPPAGAAHVVDLAERIAGSLEAAVGRDEAGQAPLARRQRP